MKYSNTDTRLKRFYKPPDFPLFPQSEPCPLFFSSQKAVNSRPLLLASIIFFFFTKQSVFDWGLKVSFGVFLLKHLWLQLCGQKLTIKPSTPPWNNGDFFIKPLNTLFPSEGLSAFMSVITLYTAYVYTLSYNKVIINWPLTAHGEAKARQN